MRIGVKSLFVVAGAILLSATAFGEIGISVGIAPPELLSYQQPICPGDGYLWTPGYWGWDSSYYWIPGEWVMPPDAGYLWTPGYWGWGGDGYMFNEGYWGLSVGFYGGIDYGFGYFGRGYRGGRWNHGHFFYNSSVNNLNRGQERNVYSQRVREGAASRISYNGGEGGRTDHATANEEAAGRGRHIAPVAAQAEHAQSARVEPKQRFSENHAAQGNEDARTAAVHPRDLPAVARGARPDTGNTGLDQKYQKQQDKLAARQDQDRQKLQQQQDNEHRQFAKQQANAGRTQQLEQRHQQQTQQMQQRHSQQTQQMGQRQSMGGGARGGGRR